MTDVEYLSIADFAEKAGVSKQAIYKQISNDNSQITPYILKDGKKTVIKISALNELYGVEIDFSNNSTQKSSLLNPDFNPTVEEKSTQVNPESQPFNPVSTPEFQPISTDYIEFLKTQVSELKAEKAEIEHRLNSIIQEKDSIIKEQSAQLAELAQQVAQIADKALITTSQQQYLTAMDKSKDEPSQIDTVPVEPQSKSDFWHKAPDRTEEVSAHKRNILKRLFGID